MNGAAYSAHHGGHDWSGAIGRGNRKQSKVVRSLKGVASYDLLDEVAREDARRMRAAKAAQATLEAKIKKWHSPPVA
jgi:hypothetical protein